ncbi:MAG TPA: amidohydrolase family protein [Candidatus Acidoferrales bacterium]
MALSISGFAPAGSSAATLSNADSPEYGLRDFSALQPIDTHVHVFKTDPVFIALLERLHLHVLDIEVADNQRIFGDLKAEMALAEKFTNANPDHASLCVTFDPFRFGQKDFTASTVSDLQQEFANGAVAVKIWKNIGMELKDADGRYVMPDDPAFDPIYQAIAAANKTLIAHVAEPWSCWQAPNPQSPDYDYYQENPEWYMYRHPDHPRKETILAARDHLLATHPNLRVVGAHLGSMETDTDDIAKRFDLYPNFAVDTAARMEYLMMQPRNKVRNFLLKYQDRVLYGTDLGFETKDSGTDVVKDWQETYARDWKFLATDQTFEYHKRQVHGLKLPAMVLRKIYRENAIRWIPGIASTSAPAK